VQLVALDDVRSVEARHDIELVTPSLGDFVESIGEMRRSSSTERAAHLERLSCAPLALHALLARVDGRTIACCQVAIDDGLAGIYDMMTVDDCRGRGLGTAVLRALLQWAKERGAMHAFLQVNADNEAALAVYRRFGFATTYTYHYRARPGECR